MAAPSAEFRETSTLRLNGKIGSKPSIAAAEMHNAIIPTDSIVVANRDHFWPISPATVITPNPTNV
jgi:hypothetical protein